MAIRPELFDGIEARNADQVEAKLDELILRAFQEGQDRSWVTLSAAGIHPRVLECVLKRYRAVGWRCDYRQFSDRNETYYTISFIRR